jgi:hypothetical protein
VSHAIRGCLPSTPAGTNWARPGVYIVEAVAQKGDPRMPVWLEILLNVIAFAGFIGIAKYHKAPGGKSPDR